MPYLNERRTIAVCPTADPAPSVAGTDTERALQALEIARNEVRSIRVGRFDNALDDAKGGIEDLVQSAITRLRNAIDADEMERSERVLPFQPQRYARV